MKYTPEIESYFKDNWDKCPYMNAVNGNKRDVPTDITCGAIDYLVDLVEKNRGKDDKDHDQYLTKQNSLIIFHKKYEHLIKDLCTYANDKIRGIPIAYPVLSHEYFTKASASYLGSTVVYIYLVTLSQKGIDMDCIRFTR